MLQARCAQDSSHAVRRKAACALPYLVCISLIKGITATLTLKNGFFSPPYLPIAPCAGLWAENQPWGSSRHCPSCRSSLQPCQRIKKRGRSILCSELMHWEWAARLIANICRARPCTGSAGGAGGPFACNWKQSRRGLHWGDNGNCTFLAMGDWAPTARC